MIYLFILEFWGALIFVNMHGALDGRVGVGLGVGLGVEASPCPMSILRKAYVTCH